MQITVFAKTNTKENKVEQITDSGYKVSVTVAPKKGLANNKIIDLLAEYFDTSKTQITLKNGTSSKVKIFEIL